MSISELHYSLVYILRSWVIENYNEKDISLYADLPGFQSPQKINSFIPDLYARIFKTNIVIIGEAKTSFDLDTSHSESQITAFLKYCSGRDNHIFLLSVPWDTKRYAINILKNIVLLNELEDIKYDVLDNVINRITSKKCLE